jgi:hypothetical protein
MDDHLLMQTILTADEFLTSILATLKLCADDYVLEEGSLDQRFERAYETLRNEGGLKVIPNFTFFRDPLHGNSTKLRDALLAAKDNGLLVPSSERLAAYTLKMDKSKAETYLGRSSLPRQFLRAVVKEHFLGGKAAADS